MPVGQQRRGAGPSRGASAEWVRPPGGRPARHGGGHVGQELRPALGLRPWFAFLRRALFFFFWVRFDIGLPT